MSWKLYLCEFFVKQNLSALQLFIFLKKALLWKYLIYIYNATAQVIYFQNNFHCCTSLQKYFINPLTTQHCMTLHKTILSYPSFMNTYISFAMRPQIIYFLNYTHKNDFDDSLLSSLQVLIFVQDGEMWGSNEILATYWIWTCHPRIWSIALYHSTME